MPIHFFTYIYTSLPTHCTSLHTHSLLCLPIHFFIHLYTSLPIHTAFAAYCDCQRCQQFRMPLIALDYLLYIRQLPDDTTTQHSYHTANLSKTYAMDDIFCIRQIRYSRKSPISCDFDFRHFLAMFAEANLINPQRCRPQNLQRTQ